MNAGRTRILLALLLVASSAASTAAQSDAERRAIVSIDRISARAPHSAFTDLVRWHGQLWCTFREGSGHVPGTNGVVRVLVSDNSEDWRTALVFDEPGIDLRDPKLSVTTDDRLMAWMGGSIYRGKDRIGMTPRVAFSSNGRDFTPLARPDFEGASEHDWMWRVTWHAGHAYGALLQLGDSENALHLMTSTDGIDWHRITTWALDGRPNESTLRFLPDGRMVAIVRREAGDRSGRIGVAIAPFEEWTWNPLPVRLGGPELAVVASGRDRFELLAGTRAHDDATRTILARVTLDGGFTKLLTLPSGGDTSYPGFDIAGDRLRVSYYSSHEERTAIYLATLRLPELLAIDG